MLTSEEAARRLGVKLATLYAYVSRGLLVAHPSGERRSLYALEDVEALARRRRPVEPNDGRLATVTTAVTDIRPGGPLYRGVPAVELAERAGFEAVADLLWQVAPGRWEPAEVGPVPVRTSADRLRWAVVMSGSMDPLRSDLRDVAVARAARTIIATMVASIRDGSLTEVEAPVADRLTAALEGRAFPNLPDAVRAALVLLADHELATSTVAVRTAASTRADVYDAVLAGLGTVSGPLHGGASRLAHLLLEDAAHRGAATALDDALRWQNTAPGFGHFLYDADPRFAALWPFVARLPGLRLETVASVVDLAEARGLPRPNVDFALAALTFVSEMDADAGGVLFKVARVAGWVAHYLEELTERPLRYRLRAVHVTPRVATGQPARGAPPGSGTALP
jgi:citrate synthase